jgi:hypothetical protein
VGSIFDFCDVIAKVAAVGEEEEEEERVLLTRVRAAHSILDMEGRGASHYTWLV